MREVGSKLPSWLRELGYECRTATCERVYFNRIRGVLHKRPDGILLRLYAIRCAMHFHLYQLARQLRLHDVPLINTY